MARQQDSLYGRKNLCSEQKENIRANSTRKPWSNRCKTPKITTNAWVNQKKLLVARNQRRYQEIYSKIYEMPTKQSSTYEESRRTLSIRNTRRTSKKSVLISLDYYWNKMTRIWLW